MALSTRARIAGLGGALALGVLGATGYAYASDGTGSTASYVTTVDDGTGTAPSSPAPSERGGTDRDCPEHGGSGSEGTEGTEGSGLRGSEGPGSASPESAPANPADA